MRLARAFRARCDEHRNQPDECTCVYWDGALAITNYTCPVHLTIIFGANNVNNEWTAQDEERFQEMSKRRDTVTSERMNRLIVAIDNSLIVQALADVGARFHQPERAPLPPAPRPPTEGEANRAIAEALRNNATAVCQALAPYRTDIPGQYPTGFTPRYPISGRD